MRYAFALLLQLGWGGGAKTQQDGLCHHNEALLADGSFVITAVTTMAKGHYVIASNCVAVYGRD